MNFLDPTPLLFRLGQRLERIWPRLYRPALIALIFALGAFIAPRAAMGGRLYLAVLALLFAIGFAVVILRWPMLGVILSILGGVLIPFSGPSSINVAVLGMAFMAGIWLFDLLVVQRRFHLAPSAANRPLLFQVAAAMLGFFVGLLPWIRYGQHAPLSAQIGGLMIFLLSFGAFLVVANMLRSLAWLEWLTWAFIGLVSLYVVGILAGLPMYRVFNNGVLAGSMFWVWYMALLVGQALFNRKLALLIRGGLLLLAAGGLYILYVYFYDWKSGWIPVLVVLAALVALRFPKLARLAAPLILVPAAIYLAMRAINSDQYSWSSRLEAWRIVINVAKASPIFGLGFANYRFYVILESFRGYYSYFNSHSQYVDLFAQVGLFGLASYLWFFGVMGKLANSLRKCAPDGFAQAYAVSVMGGIAGTLLAGYLVDWVLPFVYNIGMHGFRASMLAWIFMGGLVGLEQLTRRQTSQLVE